MASLIEHLEAHLGEITTGARGGETTMQGVQVAWFSGRPFPGVTTLVTLGLSHRHLSQPSGTGLHQELLMHLPASEIPRNAAGLLFQVADELLTSGKGLLRGEVLGPRGRLFDRGHATAVYVAAPVYLPDAFATCRVGDHEVVLTWLVPITDTEAAYVTSHGWAQFEEALVAEDPDLTDPYRAPITAAQHTVG